jgi:WhiB family redox-sensing transcriptional regulator
LTAGTDAHVISPVSFPAASAIALTETPRTAPTRATGPRTTQGDIVDLRSLLGVEEEPDELWQEKALCAQTDPESFFPEKGGSTREAKRICVECEVRVECLEYALQKDERFGIWGGLSERERRRLKKRVAS